MGIIRWLHKHDDNRQRCTLCKNSIPKDVMRVSFYYSNGYGGSSAKRICGLCLIKLSEEIKRLNEKEINEWIKKLTIKSI